MSTAIITKMEDADAVLTKRDCAEQLLSEAKTIAEVTHVMGIVEAVLAYAKTAKSDSETITYLVQLRIRAERKLGQLLAQRPKNVGSRNVPAVDANDRPTLAELGISKDQSSRAQRLAEIAKDDAELDKLCEQLKAEGLKINLTNLVGISLDPKPEIKNLTPDFQSDAVARLKELWPTLSVTDKEEFIVWTERQIEKSWGLTDAAKPVSHTEAAELTNTSLQAVLKAHRVLTFGSAEEIQSMENGTKSLDWCWVVTELRAAKGEA